MQGIGGWTLSAGPSGPPDRNKAAAAHEAFVEAEDAGEEDDAWLTADEGEFSRASSRTSKTGTHVTFAKASVRRESLGAAPAIGEVVNVLPTPRSVHYARPAQLKHVLLRGLAMRPSLGGAR